MSELHRLRVIGFPGRYVQGPGALGVLGSLLNELGVVRPVVIADPTVHAAVSSRLGAAALLGGGVLHRLVFGGECTRAAIGELTQRATVLQADGVVALGGGKTIDTAKGVARALNCRLVIAPTIASNDSPTSRLIVIYDEAHRLVGVDYLTRNPDAVLVDTAVIVEAPVRFFRAGIGDAISKTYEAAQCARAGGLNFFGGRPPDTAGVLADRCHLAIQQFAEPALADVVAKRVTPAVESVVEATVLLSGLGFESGGLSLSHALLRGLSALPESAASLHGEQVAFGSLVQLILERRSAQALEDHRSLLLRLGLPTSMHDLGLSAVGLEALQQVARLTMAAPYIGNFEWALNEDAIVQALLTANAMPPAGLHRKAS
jgi:glycerol dehydrogenase